MRWVRVLGAIVVMTCAGVWLFAYSRSKSFHVPKPDEFASSQAAGMKPTPSTIVLPVRIRLGTIQNALNTGLPADGIEHDEDTIDFLADDTTQTKWARTPLSITADPSRISVAAGVAGEFRVDYKIKNFIHDIRSHAEANVRGSASISMAPAIQENWTIKPNLSSFQINLEEADFKALGFSISAKSMTSNRIRKLVDEKLPGVEGQIASNDTIRTAISKKWADLCTTHRIGSADGSTPPAYVEVRPIAASAAQPVWDAENLNLVLGIEALISLNDTETALSCPFPEKLNLIPPGTDGDFNLNVPIDYTFKAVNKALKDSVVGRTFNDASTNINIDVRSLDIGAAGSRLLIKTDITLRKSGILGFFDGRASGIVYLLAKPVLDPQSKILRLKDVSMNVESQTALSNAFGQIAVAAVEAVLSRDGGFSYEKEIEKVRVKANAALADLATKPGPIKLGLEISDLNATNVTFDNERLIILATAKGRVNSEIVQIESLGP